MRRTRRRAVGWLGAHRSRVRIGASLVGGAVLLGVVWVVITAFLARSALEDLNDRVNRVRSLIAAGDVAGARQVAKDIPAVASRAHELTTGPAWWVAAQLPYLGGPLEVARGIGASADRIGGTVIPELMTVATSLDPATLRTGGTHLNLSPLAAAEPRLRAADTSIARAVDEMDALPTSTWFAQVDSGRARLASTLTSLRGYVRAAATASRVLPEMLGSRQQQRYFIGLQNEAELRGTGGLTGAFAIATVRGGTIRFTDFESNTRLDARGSSGLPTGLDFGADYASLYGRSVPTSSFQNSNVSPHFPYAAQIWARMWQQVSGQRIDGVIALDPTSLSYFLAATGPATVQGGITVTSANVVTLLQRDQYTLFADDFQARKRFVVDVLRAASKKLEDGGGSGLGLLQAATLSAQQQRLLVWDRDPSVQQALVSTNFAGALPGPDRAVAAPVLNNASAGKIDFYLNRSFDYVRSGCGPTRDAVATLTLSNSAPRSGLPGYVTERVDRPPRGAVPGSVREIVDYYATAGSQLLGVMVDGKPAAAAVARERRLQVFRFDLEIPPGAARVVELHLAEPARPGATVIWRQPGATPLAVTSRQQVCA